MSSLLAVPLLSHCGRPCRRRACRPAGAASAGAPAGPARPGPGQRHQRRHRQPGRQAAPGVPPSPRARPFGQQQPGVPVPGSAVPGPARRVPQAQAAEGRARAVSTRDGGLADRLEALTRRGNRPVSRVHGGEQRVLRVGLRRIGPRETWATPDLRTSSRNGDGSQPAAAALAPPVARAAQPNAAPRGGHVHQPALSTGPLAAHALAEGLRRGGVAAEELRQVSGVPAQAERDQPRVVGPPGGHPRPGRGTPATAPPWPGRARTRPANCRPLAACAVSSLTESDSPTRPVSRRTPSC